jgi:hypothetical protein
MASKSRSPTSGRLLQGLAITLFANHAGRLTTIHVPGVENIMADIASRPTKVQNFFVLMPPFLTPISHSHLTPHSHYPTTSGGLLQMSCSG